MPTPPAADTGPAQLRGLIRAAAARLQTAGVPSPDHDARALARLALSATDGGILEVVAEVSPAFAGLFEAMIARREAREPLQLIAGEAHFHGVTLATAAGVFIPRPETESLVAAALKVAPLAARIVDLCTGSGTIAIALARALPAAEVWAVELDPRAAELARHNAAANGVRVVVVEGAAADALPELDGSIDLVVSNPPYIPPDGVPRDPEVRLWDPPLALYGGGDDGLATPREVIARAAELLRPEGAFFMEHGDEQGAAVRGLVSENFGFSMVETHQDLAGRDRFVQAQRAADGGSR